MVIYTLSEIYISHEIYVYILTSTLIRRYLNKVI
nr:MAG TPA: hypothetical protein [Caudoviricetes sp.]